MCVHVCGACVCVCRRVCVHVLIQILLFSIVSLNRGPWVLACACMCVIHARVCAGLCAWVRACVHTNSVVSIVSLNRRLWVLACACMWVVHACECAGVCACMCSYKYCCFLLSYLNRGPRNDFNSLLTHIMITFSGLVPTYNSDSPFDSYVDCFYYNTGQLSPMQ